MGAFHVLGIAQMIPNRVKCHVWDKVFKSRLSKFCGRQPLKKLNRCGLLKQIISLQIFQRLSSTKFTYSTLENICTLSDVMYPECFNP